MLDSSGSRSTQVAPKRDAVTEPDDFLAFLLFDVVTLKLLSLCRSPNTKFPEDQESFLAKSSEAVFQVLPPPTAKV